MKTIVILLLLLPCITFAQKQNYGGVYKTPEPDPKAHLKVWDTIRESYTFIADSFKYSYSVMRPNGRGAVSVEYDEYGTWKISRIDSEKRKDASGNEGLQYRIFVAADEGRMNGYFETPPYPGAQNDPGHGPRNAFFYNNRKFIFAEPARKPLLLNK
jgi:hypothetical protein